MQVDDLIYPEMIKRLSLALLRKSDTMRMPAGLVDFLLGLVLIELSSFARCYGWGATSEYRFKIGDFTPTDAGWPKISDRRGRRHPPTME